MASKFPDALPDFNLTKTHIKLLKYARKRIRQGLSDAVCGAINWGATHPEDSGITCKDKTAIRASADLRRFISRAIEKNVYLCGWQCDNGVHRNSEELRKDRIKWLTYLLENSEAWD